MSLSFNQRILAWHQLHGRHDLPWQQNMTPYRVWVSEIMLQQTQVSTVIDYYQRFMARFPDVFSLASAAQDEVLHLWTGLGYYARGRNLHQCAKTIVRDYGGEFPRSTAQLCTLPGIGRSTAAAIASISMNIPAAILDGNVKRVLTRHFAIEGWPGQGAIEKELWQLAEQLAPSKQCGTYTQAMMDLGATLCTRSKPACERCPLQASCQGYQTGTPTQFPSSKPKATKPEKAAVFLMIQNPAGEFLLQQRPTQGLWGGLWCFPEAEDLAAAMQLFTQLLPGTPANTQPLLGFRHTFSHYHLDIQPLLLSLTRSPSQVSDTDNLKQCWYNPHQPLTLGLAAPVKKLLEQASNPR